LSAIRVAAVGGDAASMRQLGLAHVNGDGVARDATEGARWLLRAAEAKDSLAQLSIGMLYDEGRGVERNPFEAARWYRAAAEREDGALPAAQFNLGDCFARGDGVRKDLGEAMKWFRRSDELGYADAQFVLANCYLQGQGVTRDLTLGMAILQKAAAQGQTNAVAQLAFIQSRQQPAAAQPLPPPTKDIAAPPALPPVRTDAASVSPNPFGATRPSELSPGGTSLRREPPPAAPSDTNAAVKAEPSAGFVSATSLIAPTNTPTKETVQPVPASPKEVTAPATNNTPPPVTPPTKEPPTTGPETSATPDANPRLAETPAPFTALESPGTRTAARDGFGGSQADSGGFTNTQFELSKADVNLSAMLKQVEALSLGEAHNPKQIERPEWLRDDAGKSRSKPAAAREDTAFKNKRTSAVL